MVAALERSAGSQLSALIDRVPDPVVTRLMNSFPARIRAERAERLGLAADPDLSAIIGIYRAESQH
jgi:hypothetical protein